MSLQYANEYAARTHHQSEAAGSAAAQALRADSVPMQQAAKHTAGALARL